MESSLPETTFDYIIAGQGLAGSLLSYYLEMAGKTALVIDPGLFPTSSRIAAGIVHPVTGRRIVKSWRADELIPFAEQAYRLLEQKFRKTFYFNRPILEIFHSVNHMNDWLARSGEDSMQHYTGERIESNGIAGINMPLGGMIVRGGGHLLISELLEAMRIGLAKKHSLLEETLDYNLIRVHEKIVSYRHITARGIIFCEGADAIKNPFFCDLPFVPAKGEILTISAPGLTEEYILNKSLYLLPMENGQFRAGATNEWQELNNIPTIQARQKMERLLSGIIQVPFEITDHLAAVRPTVKDRRPFLGSSPKSELIFIFNGLGTKGVMLAPYFASHLCDHLVLNKKIDPESDIRRFIR